jgi:hypothetical protein
VTSGNLARLADGFGTTLRGAYVARAHYLNRSEFTNYSPELADLIAYANATTSLNANSAKFFFGNETKDGKAAVSFVAKKILKDANGSTDIYGAYGLKAGSPGADAFGNSSAVSDRT